MGGGNRYPLIRVFYAFFIGKKGNEEQRLVIPSAMNFVKYALIRSRISPRYGRPRGRLFPVRAL